MTVSSSDGVLFKVHRKNLEFHSDVFADAANATLPQNDDEIVQLSETSDVLDLLFQYMYRQRQPELKDVTFKVLAGLAEAAEKYVVPAALDCCLHKIWCVLMKA
jgi:DNA-binding transcriptional regulator YbjK